MDRDNADRQPTEWNNSEQQTLIMKNENQKKKNSLLPMLEKFRLAAKFIIFLMRGFRHTKIYFKDEEAELKIQNRLRAMLLQTKTSSDEDLSTISPKCTIGCRLNLCLTTLPYYRNDATIKQILWFLRATKAFKSLFPVEMEMEVAKYVEYARPNCLFRYDDGRVIANQGRRPEYLYCVISGRLKLVREFRLANGVVTKFMGFITKGKTTDPAEMNGGWPREDILVASGQVEVLLLNKEAFSYLQHTTEGLPLEFIRSLRFFQRFPVESFLNNPDATEYKYYGEGKIIVEDSNRTPWIYIVKSGFVKVVRCQLVKYRLKFRDNCRRLDEGRTDTTGRESNNKAVVNLNDDMKHLPKICELRYLNELYQPLKKQRQNTSPSLEDKDWNSHDTMISVSRWSSNESRQKCNSKRYKLLSRRFEANNDKTETSSKEILPNDSNRETSETELCWFPVLNRTNRKEKQRIAFLQLDTLTKGDIFGLDHLQPTIATEPKGVSLVSGGAEVIQIRKRFCMNYFGSDASHAIDSLCKEYISEKQAEEDLLNQESWRRYKASVYQSATASCCSSSSSSNRRCINR